MKLKEFFLIIVILVGFGKQSVAHATKQSATLIVIDPSGQETDSMTLYIWDEYLIENLEDFVPVKRITKQSQQGKYIYKINSLEHIKYFTLAKGETDRGFPMPLLEHYLIEPGDSITIEFNGYSPKIQKYVNESPKQTGWIVSDLAFSGSGVAKYRCKNSCNKVLRLTGTPLEISNVKRLDSATRVRLEILKSYELQLSNIAYQMLKLDIIGRFFQSKYRQVVNDEAIQFYKTEIDEISEGIRISSKEYFESEFINLKAKYTSLDSEQKYLAIKRDYTGQLRDKLMTTLLLYWYSSLNNGEELVNDALNQIQTDFLKKILFDLSEYLAEGSTAYNFSLPDAEGKIVKLSDFKGKVVVIDFWFNKCGACQDYYIYQLSKVEEQFKDDRDVVFITINIDRNKKLWIDGINDGKHTSPEIINLNTGELGSDHPVIKHYKIIGYPRPMVIDKKGKIYRANGKDLRVAEKLNRIIEAAKKRPT